MDVELPAGFPPTRMDCDHDPDVDSGSGCGWIPTTVPRALSRCRLEARPLAVLALAYLGPLALSSLSILLGVLFGKAALAPHLSDQTMLGALWFTISWPVRTASAAGLLRSASSPAPLKLELACGRKLGYAAIAITVAHIK